MSAAFAPGHQVTISELGDEPLEAIEQHASLSRWPRPIRRRCPPRDVIVAVKSASVGWVDLLMTSGQYQHMAKPPYTPGPRVRGRRRVGGRRGRQRSRSATRVLVDRSSPARARWAPTRPTAASRRTPSRRSRRCSGSRARCRSTRRATCSATTRPRTTASSRAGGSQAGETVLIHGASGSTGLAAVHVAKLLGATVIATGRSDAKLAS